MDRAQKISIVVPETDPMGSAPSDPPQDIILWKVKLKTSGDIDILYEKAARDSLNDGTTIDDFLKEVVSGSLIDWREPNYCDPGPTSLSIHHPGYSYIVLVLENKNWQFSQGIDPFRVERGKSKYYLDPKCAWMTEGGPQVGRTPPEDVTATVACFIANATADQADSTTKPNFRTRFNIYLDIILKRTGRKPRLLPIAIDPDVGYPEGTKP